MNIFFKILFVVAAALALSLSGCSKPAEKPVSKTQEILQVYKRETCGCCGKWVDHMEASGYVTQVTNLQDLAPIKQKFGIPDNFQSCHTAIQAGYFFEGHIPEEVISRFLSEKPQGALGLAVPGMPLGSPGMEYKEQFHEYPVFQINDDGSHSTYAKVQGRVVLGYASDAIENLKEGDD